ncbi:unnamed protein product, partial [Rotaria sordida]
FQIEIVKAFQLLISTISSTSAISVKTLDIENPQLDLVHDDSIKSLENLELEDLEDKCLLINIYDLDLKIQPQPVDVVNDCDKLEQQGKSVIISGSIKSDIEDTLETVAGGIGSLTADDSVINIVVLMDIQYL